MTGSDWHTCARCRQTYDRAGVRVGPPASWCLPCRRAYSRAQWLKRKPPPRPKPTEAERLWNLIDVRTPWECWPFQGRARSGRRKRYGQFTLAGRPMTAHRAIWIVTFGMPPPELHVDHRCGVHLCCNPAHLRLLTAQENGRDGARRAAAMRRQMLDDYFALVSRTDRD